MAFDVKSTKVRVDKILVGDENAALATTGTALSNLTTDGQLGVYNQYTNLANTAPSFSTDPAIYIAQGQSTTLHTYPLPARPQERSMPIDGQYVYRVKKATYAAPTNNVWIIGDTNGQTGEINVADETLYELTIKFDGRRTDILNGRNQPAIFPQFETPDYSADGPATEVLQRDDLVQNLVYEIQQQSILKRQSGSQVIALAINTANTGVGSGTTIAGVTPGTAVTIGFNSDGSELTWTPTAAEVAGMDAAVAAYVAAVSGTTLASTSEIVKVLIATPPTGSAAASAVTATTAAVAGTSTNADVIILIAKDDTTGYFDRIPQTKVSFDVGLRQGFNTATVTNREDNKSFEGTGVGRHWALEYESSDELRKFDTSQAPGAYAIQYPSPVDSAATYNSYTVTHGLPIVTTAGTVSLAPFETIVLIESGDTTTTTAFEAALDGWLQSLPVTPPYNFASGTDL